MPVELTDEERAAIEALQAEQEKLEDEYENADELPNSVDARLGEIETALAAFEDRPVNYLPGEIACAGAFVSIARDGTLFVDRGYVRPEDEQPAIMDAKGEPENGRYSGNGGEQPWREPQIAVIHVGGQPEAEEDEDDTIKPLPDRLVSELTAYRTLALQDAVACNPHVAMTALLHKLCLDTFQHGPSGSCLEASVRHVHFPIQPTDLKDSASAKAIAERQEAWSADVPKDEAALWDWLASLHDDSRAALLAHCVSFGVNALHEKGDRYGGPGLSVHGVQRRLIQADRLAQAVRLDMVEAGWRPTVDTYLGRVTKPRILEAVREAKGEQAAQLIDHLKKHEMAKEAQRLLVDTGWLPEPLRTQDTGAVDAANGGLAADADALPAFLADDEEDSGAEETDEPDVIAAE
jgi:ParB family transcriptional regulator, chromosome partitioning protein